MQKGQLSFDLLLASVIIIVFLGNLMTLSDFIAQEETERSNRAKAKSVLAQIAGITAAAKTIADAKQGSRIEFLVPKIGKECTLAFDTVQNQAEITVKYNSQAITERKEMFFDTTKFSYTENDCGNKIRIEKT